MSKEGIELVAKIFSEMQERRIKLLSIGTEQGVVDWTDIQLASLLLDMKDFAKERFELITLNEHKT
jgi:hypothetical protein